MTRAVVEIVVVAEAVQRVDGALAGELVGRHAARGRAERLKGKDGFRIQLEAAVEAAEVVVPLNEIVARGDQAERVLAAEVALQTQDADISVLVEERLHELSEEGWIGARRFAILIAEVAGRVVRGDEQAE